MDKFDEMLTMFFRNGGKGWSYKVARQILELCDLSNQVFEFRGSSGKLRGFVAWYRCTDADIDRFKEHLAQKKEGLPAAPSNRGPHLFPLLASFHGLGFGMKRRIEKYLRSLAGDGLIVSFRKRRIMVFGRGNV